MRRGSRVVVLLIVVAVTFSIVTLAAVLILRRGAGERTLLLIEAIVDVTTDAPAGTAIPANFGPHCAAVRYSGASRVTIDNDVFPPDAIGILLIRYRPSEAFDHSGGDLVAVQFFRPNARTLSVPSSVDPERVLFTIGYRGPTAMAIGGELYDVGRPFVDVFVTPVVIGQDAWSVTEAFAGRNAGPVAFSVTPPPLCA